MKMFSKLTFTLLVVASAAAAAHAQQTKPLVVSPDESVRNDDGGRAFILERNLRPLSSFSASRKGVISEPQQFSIFAGAGWSDPKLRERETALGNLLTNVSSESEIEALQSLGIQNRFAPTVSNEQLDAPSGLLRDLDAQRLLANMIGSGLLPAPNGSTVYVIFLDASFQSTLGDLSAGKHYVAYHSTFNFSGSSIRYVVVPFESDPATSYQIALRAFLAAATKRVQRGK